MRTCAFEKLKRDISRYVSSGEIDGLLNQLEEAVIERDAFMVDHVISGLLGGFVARSAMMMLNPTLSILFMSRMLGFCLSKVVGHDLSLGAKFVTSRWNYSMPSYCESLYDKCRNSTMANSCQTVLENELRLVRADLGHYQSGLVVIASAAFFSGVAALDTQNLMEWLGKYIHLPTSKILIDMGANVTGLTVGAFLNCFIWGKPTEQNTSQADISDKLNGNPNLTHGT